jgi:hypothetical protein
MLQGSIAMHGLNDTPSDCEIYGHNCDAPTTTGTKSSESIWDKINKGATALSTVWGAYKAGSGSGTGTTNNGGGAPQGSNTMKYVLIGGGVLVGGLAIWGIASAVKGKGKKK